MKKKRIVLGLVLIDVVFVVWLCLSIWWTRQAFTQLKTQRLLPAARSAQLAQPLAETLSVLSFRKAPLIETWRYGLSSIQAGAVSFQTVTSYLQALQGPENLKTPQLASELYNQLSTLENQLLALDHALAQSRLSESKADLIPQIDRLQKTTRAIQALKTLLKGDQTYLLLLQNSHELRATGGFIGSYIRLSAQDGVLTELKLEDIYVPDGQFSGFVTPPPGVAEYLSSGKGMRLPDANWSPDFPTSAQAIMSYFALGEEQTVDGVIAVNLKVGEDILALTGPLELSDYDVTVTSQNLADVARADRDQFFPGSQQKKNFLSSLMTHLKLKLSELNSQDQQQLMGVLMDGVEHKDIQVFSYDPTLQSLWDQLTVSGRLSDLSEPDLVFTKPVFSLFPVESNVGINKANREVTRENILSLGQTTSTLRQKWTVGSLPYINYHRVFLNANSRVVSITVNGKKIENWDSEVITTSGGERWLQVGFLVPAPAHQTSEAILTFEHSPLSAESTISLLRQAGVPPSPFTVVFGAKTFLFSHQTDLRLSMTDLRETTPQLEP